MIPEGVREGPRLIMCSTCCVHSVLSLQMEICMADISKAELAVGGGPMKIRCEEWDKAVQLKI